MRTQQIIVSAAVILAVTLVFVALQANLSKRAIVAQVTEATKHRARLRAELLQSRGGSSVEISKETVASASGETTAVMAPPDFPPRTRPPGLLDFARNDPRLWNDFIQSKRAELGRLHAPFFQRLNLTATQQERFKDILAADIARGSDIGAAADAQGLSQSDPAIQALRENAEKQRKAELAELLGPVGFRELDAFERALPVRGFVDGLAIQLALSAPVSEQQANQLERVLAETNEAYRAGKPADPRVVDWDAVDARAREILSPEQFAVWKRGLAHNMFGGSRQSQELQKVYERALRRATKADL